MRLTVVCLAALVFFGCGSDEDSTPPPPNATANVRLLDGGRDAFQAYIMKQKGKPVVVNKWASWCGPCRLEHPILMELSKRTDIRLYGINNKDKPENARRFLGTLGQPFAAIGADTNGRTTIDWGSYGVPETFIVDGKGIIRFKWIGPLSAEIMTGVFANEIEKAKLPAVVD